MIGFFLPFALRLFGPKLAKAGAWAATILSAILALVALWGLATCAIHRHDKRVVNAYESGVQATVHNEVSAATNVADAQANVTAAVNEERHNQVEEAINNAVTAHPAEAHRSAGPASSAALDRLRHRPR